MIASAVETVDDVDEPWVKTKRLLLLLKLLADDVAVMASGESTMDDDDEDEMLGLKGSLGVCAMLHEAMKMLCCWCSCCCRCC